VQEEHPAHSSVFVADFLRLYGWGSLENKAMIKQDIVYAKYGVLLFLSNLSLDQYHKGA